MELERWWLSNQPKWLEISGFEEIDGDDEYSKNYRKIEPRVSVSAYGDTNPQEDFAETYAMYRFDPMMLKKISPERYEFMKNEVFDGIEYLNDLCHGTRFR